MTTHRWSAIAAGSTYAFIIAILFVLMRGSQQATTDGVTTDSGGRTALMALALATVLPWFIQRFDVQVPKWLPWAIGGVSLAITAALWSLVAAGLNSLAWAAYGGLQVLRGRANFNDLDWDIRWLACDLCDKWNPHYGPSLALANPITGGLIDVGWVTPLGFALAGALALGLVWLARESTGRGVLVLMIAAVGPAWLLQQDRANLDGLVFVVIVFGAWLVRRRESLLTWSVFAALIWVIGTLKYYPFAVGIALLPALRLRRGWTVIAGFVLASVTFMALAWSDFRDSLRWNGESILVTWDFPAYGRLMVLSRMGEFSSNDSWLGLGNLLFLGMAACAVLWGLAWSSDLHTKTVAKPVMALGGGTVFLSAVLIGGFGFMYKGAFLLPLIPLLSLPLRTRSGQPRMRLYTSLVALICIGFAMMVAYASVLTTLAGIVAASIGVGAGLGLTWRGWRQARASASHSSIAAS